MPLPLPRTTDQGRGEKREGKHAEWIVGETLTICGCFMAAATSSIRRSCRSDLPHMFSIASSSRTFVMTLLSTSSDASRNSDVSPPIAAKCTPGALIFVLSHSGGSPKTSLSSFASSCASGNATGFGESEASFPCTCARADRCLEHARQWHRNRWSRERASAQQLTALRGGSPPQHATRESARQL